MDRIEFDRLRDAFRRREKKRTGVLIAKVLDISPRIDAGYVMAQLKDGTQINVHAWNLASIGVGESLFVTQYSEDNWYICLGVNATITPDTVPYLQAAMLPGALPAHQYNSHSGKLSWENVDTSQTQVDLRTQVSGLLPTALQAPQAAFKSITITTGEIGPNAVKSGIVTLGTSCAYIRRLDFGATGQGKLRLYEGATSVIQYETNPIATLPWTDRGGWFHIDRNYTDSMTWEVTNTHPSSSNTYAIVLEYISWKLT